MTIRGDSGPRARSKDDTIDLMHDLPFRERSRAELLDDLRASLEEVLSGEFRPALEVLDELDGEAMDDADAG